MGEEPARVLVVDDEAFFREAIRETLAHASIPCLLAADGAEALELSPQPQLGAVVLDIQMPGMDGIEVLRRLRESRPLLRVIILSAHTDQEYVLQALRLGACDYLAKPLHEEELVLSVRRALESHAMAERWERLRSRLRTVPRTLAELRDATQRDEGPERATAIAAEAARAAARLLEAGRASIMLLDEAEGRLRVVAGVGHPLPVADLDAVPVGEGVSGTVFARGEALLEPDARQNPLVRPESASRYTSSSFVVAPLAGGEGPLGVVCASERSAAGAFDEDDLSLLEVLADGVAGLLHQERAGPAEPELELDALAEDTLPPAPDGLLGDGDPSAEAELARAICAVVTSEVAPERVLSGVLAAASAALGDAPVSMHLADPDNGELRVEAQRDAGQRPDREKLPRGRGLTGTVFETRTPVAAIHPETDPRFDPAVDTPEDGAAGPLVCVPLCFRGKSLGVFRAFPSEPRQASPRTAEVLAATLSAAVRNVFLYRSLLDSIEQLARARREAGERASG